MATIGMNVPENIGHSDNAHSQHQEVQTGRLAGVNSFDIGGNTFIFNCLRSKFARDKKTRFDRSAVSPRSTVVDGNGRIHRYLIHHVLAERGFAPKGFVFPASAVILEHIDDSRQVLEAFSRPRLKHIRWQSLPDGNVDVLNETIDLYRYFDATRQAEFLYECVTRMIEHNLPEEIVFLERYDRMKSAVTERFDMPDHMVDLLIGFLGQNNGVFSKRAKEREFKAFTETERSELETLYVTIFTDEI